MPEGWDEHARKRVHPFLREFWKNYSLTDHHPGLQSYGLPDDKGKGRERSERGASSKKGCCLVPVAVPQKKSLTVASAFILEYIKAGEEQEMLTQEAIQPKDRQLSGQLSERG